MRKTSSPDHDFFYYAKVFAGFLALFAIPVLALALGTLIKDGVRELLLLAWAGTLRNIAWMIVGNWLLIQGFIEFGFWRGLANGWFLYLALQFADELGGYLVMAAMVAFGTVKRVEALSGPDNP